MRDWSTEGHGKTSLWFWIKASVVAMVVIGGYVALASTAWGWLSDAMS